MAKDIILTAEKAIDVRFSEVDMMGVVWHGNYPTYLEDAREAFGEKYGLSYHRYIKENIFAPLVDIKLQYKHPIKYGQKPVVKITYRPTEAAKIIFDYEIYDPSDGTVFFTGYTVQVFMNRDYQLLWFSPDFYTEWKKQMGLE